MVRNQKFDDIRPYYDDEIPAAMKRIAASDTFPLLASYAFPDRKVEEVRAMVEGLRTVDEFQTKVMWFVNEQIVKRSMTSYTVSGIEALDPSGQYLFVSNHRDIMLDASVLQNILHAHGFETSEITFGANLMCTPLVIDIGRSNKMFRVERGGNMKEFYQSSVHLSEYIRHVITEKHQSVWIAQRNGRTKDGNDATDQGIVKMFGISKRDDKIRALSELHIVPLSISYEWETCDYMKALELYQSRYEKYVKKQGEDLSSILSGITSFKGNVHLSFCPMITEDDLRQFDSLTSIEYNREVARLMDERIFSGYKLTPNNFIAHDIRFGKHEFLGAKYSEEQKERFVFHMSKLDKYDVEEPEILRDIFLGIYSNPVDNCYMI
ncbi:MAG: 1-acyl-sn-glycerol-3-phosphate acyltransferase [Bacteroidales bacterium]|nr:1-acyl-sn-glycerol-3-phosphate acyltransferase [Bacteroidales bacterium]MEE3476805.1 1-acyl-sn-glycerol-3-phosphate acyltransferase [Candidatus Cryptobacteroides sp.]